MTNINHTVKCIQINLQHSRLASAWLAQLVLNLNTDIVFIQEPYSIKKELLIPDIPNGCITKHCLDHNAAYEHASSLNPQIME